MSLNFYLIPLRAFLCIFFSVFLSSCASIRSVSLTSIPAQRSGEIRAEATKMIFLGFNFNNDFVDNIAEQLKNQCQGGQVRGILTKDETIVYFLFFLYQYRVTATGYCSKMKSNVASQESI